VDFLLQMIVMYWYAGMFPISLLKSAHVCFKLADVITWFNTRSESRS